MWHYMLTARWWWSFIIITMNITYHLELSIIFHVLSDSTNDYDITSYDITVYVLMMVGHLFKTKVGIVAKYCF